MARSEGPSACIRFYANVARRRPSCLADSSVALDHAYAATAEDVSLLGRAPFVTGMQVFWFLGHPLLSQFEDPSRLMGPSSLELLPKGAGQPIQLKHTDGPRAHELELLSRSSAATWAPKAARALPWTGSAGKD